MRYFIKLGYKGTNFHGWQVQPNAISVQECIEKALTILLKFEISIVGCGRTDTGVHAKEFYAHFNAEKLTFSLERLTFKLNAIIANDDIAIHEIFIVDDESHARFNATARSYEYHLHQLPNPFIQELSLKYTRKLDFESMNEAAKELLHYSDFASFCKSHAGNHTNICDVREAYWEECADGKWIFHITADRFLRNMVRSIVGTLLQIGSGKLTLSDFKKIIESKSRSKAGESVPAHGLYLSKVTYPFLNNNE